MAALQMPSEQGKTQPEGEVAQAQACQAVRAQATGRDLTLSADVSELPDQTAVLGRPGSAENDTGSGDTGSVATNAGAAGQALAGTPQEEMARKPSDGNHVRRVRCRHRRPRTWCTQPSSGCLW